MTSSEPDSPLRVAYILKMFPRLSETFILNELLELENQGVELSVFSLMYPADGRFHGRLGGLNAAARYFPREKPESYWSRIRNMPDGCAPDLASWQEAADFLKQWHIPKDLDLLLRAVVISAEMTALGIQHIHAHFATISTRVAALVSMLTGIPFSFTSHAKDIFRETVDRGHYADLVRRSTFNITVSDFNREFILEHTPSVDAEKIVRLYNGIDLDYFAPAPRTPRSEDSPCHVLSIGRLVAKKGFDHLLRALDIWKRNGGRFRATIVGDGEDRDALHELCETLGLVDEVTFTGALAQEQVRELCADADVMTLACVPDEIGNRDALPTTLLEGLAFDLPIVSTRLTGVPEIVGEDGGVVVEPADAAALATALRETSERACRGEFTGGTARKRAERLFDLRKNVAVLHQHFKNSARS